jgi:hypothetical protein
MNSVKEHIAADLKKAKTAGGQRLERIGKIIQDALSQAVSELKEGSSEIQSIAKESTLIETLKPKSTTTATVATPAPVEVKIDEDDDVTDVVIIIEEPVTDAETELQSELILDDIINEIPNAVASEVSSETVSDAAEAEAATAEPKAVQSLIDSANAAIDRLVAFANDEKTRTMVQPYLDKLNATLGLLDEKIAARYGDRYSSFKQEFQQDMGKAKVWYTETRANMDANGTSWVDQKQAELEVKLGETGATIAQKEAKIKQLAKEFWQTVKF